MKNVWHLFSGDMKRLFSNVVILVVAIANLRADREEEGASA